MKKKKVVELEKKLRSRKAVVGIIGLGYVGLPLSVELARAGYTTLGYDVQAKKVQQVNKGISYIGDVADETLREVVRRKKLRATTHFAEFRRADVMIICVPTPLNQYLEPDISYVTASTKKAASVLRKEQLVILESTTYPGTTEEVVLPILEKKGLMLGKDFFLAFSPERVDPGNKHYNTANTPKVVGGMTTTCTRLAKIVYESFIPKIHTVSSPRVAEMEKLLENIFRIVNVSLVNELALLCSKMNIDIWEVIEAASTKPYGFMPFFPGPGIGGHCIPIDPFYLSWKARQYNFATRFIQLAGEINMQMPEHVVSRVIQAMNLHHGKALRGAKILLLGVAYKKDISDVRESPALHILDLLHQRNAVVAYHDPHVPALQAHGTTYVSVPLSTKALRSYDCVVIVTDHSKYNYDDLAQSARLIVDTRNAVKSRAHKHVHRL